MNMITELNNLKYDLLRLKAQLLLAKGNWGHGGRPGKVGGSSGGGGGGGREQLPRLSDAKVFDNEQLTNVTIKDFVPTTLFNTSSVKELLKENGISKEDLLKIKVEYRRDIETVAYSDMYKKLYINYYPFAKLNPIEQRSIIVHELAHAAQHIGYKGRWDPYKEDNLSYWDRPREKYAFTKQLQFLKESGVGRKEAEYQQNGDSPNPKFKKMISTLADQTWK